MAWIESHQKLKEESKLFDLAATMGWSKAEAIGRLHMFWWWCVDHAEDGDITKFTPQHFALVIDIEPAKGAEFMEAMRSAEFIECITPSQPNSAPIFRIRNWWRYVRRFMQSRYKNEPKKWRKIASFYKSPHRGCIGVSLSRSIGNQHQSVPSSTSTKPIRTES